MDKQVCQREIMVFDQLGNVATQCLKLYYSQFEEVVMNAMDSTVEAVDHMSMFQIQLPCGSINKNGRACGTKD